MKNKLVGLSLFSLVLISLISFTNASMPVYIITGYDDFTVTYGPNNLTTYNVSILAYRKGRIGFDTGITETFVLGNSKFYLYNRTILPVSLMVGPIENDSYTYTYAAPELVWETVTHVPNVTLVYNNSYQLQNKELIDFDELNTYNWYGLHNLTVNAMIEEIIIENVTYVERVIDRTPWWVDWWNTYWPEVVSGLSAITLGLIAYARAFVSKKVEESKSWLKKKFGR